MDLKILGRVGTHFFFQQKNMSLCILKGRHFAFQNEYKYIFLRVLGNISCDLEVKCQIMYFLVNVSPPKPLDIATSNLVAA